MLEIIKKDYVTVPTTPRITTLSRWSSLCASVILRAVPARIRVSLVGLTIPDRSRSNVIPGPPGWGLGGRLTTCFRINNICYRNMYKKYSLSDG